MKTGIMGGTFDPIHYGHLRVARIAQVCASLDRVLFLPSGNPPHKHASTLASAVDRLNMTALGVYGEPDFTVSPMETEREGVIYTVDTLRLMRAASPEDELFYIVGGDTLFTLDTWRQPEKLREYCAIVAVPRPGANGDALRERAAEITARLGVRVLLAGESGPGVSSTSVREAASRGEPLESLTPAADYIASHGLYGCPLSPVSASLRSTLTESRFRHTLSVAATATHLAVLYGVDPARAHLAGLLHDCAKGMDASKLIQLIRQGGISVDEIELSLPALLHAPAGAALAKRDYGVSDPEVLSAIRWHTTGRRAMSPVEKVVFLADFVEPLRPAFRGLDRVQQAASRDLDEAVHMAARESAQYVIARGKKLHPRTLELCGEL